MTERYQQILEASAELFRDHGYEATSMRDIADAVDLQPGSLYAHIGSKADLLFDIIDQATERFLLSGAEAVASGGSPLDRLQRLVLAHLRLIDEHAASTAVFLHEWRSLEGEHNDIALAKRRQYEGYLRQLLDEGIASGEIREVDTKLVVTGLLSVVNWVSVWYVPGRSPEPAEIAEAYVELMLHGLRDKGVR